MRVIYTYHKNIKKNLTLDYHTVMCAKDADRLANHVNPEDETDLGLHCLPRPVSPKAYHKNSNKCAGIY